VKPARSGAPERGGLFDPGDLVATQGIDRCTRSDWTNARAITTRCGAPIDSIEPEAIPRRTVDQERLARQGALSGIGENRR